MYNSPPNMPAKYDAGFFKRTIAGVEQAINSIARHVSIQIVSLAQALNTTGNVGGNILFDPSIYVPGSYFRLEATIEHGILNLKGTGGAVLASVVNTGTMSFVASDWVHVPDTAQTAVLELLTNGGTPFILNASITVSIMDRR